MQIIRHIHSIPSFLKGSIVTIGNFDGMHVGHQALLSLLLEKKRETQLPIVLVLFEPQPKEYFLKSKAPARLNRLKDKLAHLKNYLIDYVFCLRFNGQLSNLSASDFISQFLVERLRVRYFFTGADFRFGKEREGNLTLLYQHGERANFDTLLISDVLIDGVRVSSTRVRQCLAEGDFITAKKLLGRNYAIAGRVQLGDQRGRLLGFPTANIALHRIVSPLSGVFVVDVFGLPGAPHRGVANVGCRPTVGGHCMQMEVHLFHFAEDIYGKFLNVVFIKKIRDEKKFESLDALKQQIQDDCITAQQFR